MTLKLYAVVLELVRKMRPQLQTVRNCSAALGDQLERALISIIPLDVAEGAYSRGKSRQVRFQTAMASAREALACWETAQAMGWVGALDPEVAALFHQVIGTLVRLVRPRK
jgi:four helix bundle protein